MPISRRTMKLPHQTAVPSGSTRPEWASTSSRTLDFGSRASRSPSPKTLRESTVSRIIAPGRNVSSGAVVDQLEAGRDHRPPGGVRRLDPGAEERERRLEQHVVGDVEGEEDDDRRPQVRQQLAEHHPQRAGALGDRRLDELFLAQRKHLAAQRPRHVGDVDDADDQRRDPDRGPGDRDRPDLEPADRQRGSERDPEQQHGEGPDDVEDAGDHGIDPAAVVAGHKPEHDREQRGDQRRDQADEQRGPPSVHQPDHLVAPEAPVGAEEELAAGLEPDGADRLPVGGDDVALFAVDGDLFEGVGVVRPGFGDVSRSTAGRRGRRR